MSDIDFKTDFLDPVIDLTDAETEVRQTYIIDAIRNMTIFSECSAEITRLSQIQFTRVSDTKTVYTFIDNSKLDKLKQTRKQILMQQKTRLEQFLHFYELTKKVEKSVDVPKDASILVDSVSEKSIKSNISFKADSIKRRKVKRKKKTTSLS